MPHIERPPHAVWLWFVGGPVWYSLSSDAWVYPAPQLRHTTHRLGMCWWEAAGGVTGEVPDEPA